MFDKTLFTVTCVSWRPTRGWQHRRFLPSGRLPLHTRDAKYHSLPLVRGCREEIVLRHARVSIHGDTWACSLSGKFFSAVAGRTERWTKFALYLLKLPRFLEHVFPWSLSCGAMEDTLLDFEALSKGEEITMFGRDSRLARSCRCGT